MSSVNSFDRPLFDAYSKWKVKSTLKKKPTGAKAVFAVHDGKYSVKTPA
jgi:hypothetical protein